MKMKRNKGELQKGGGRGRYWVMCSTYTIYWKKVSSGNTLYTMNTHNKKILKSDNYLAFCCFEFCKFGVWFVLFDTDSCIPG